MRIGTCAAAIGAAVCLQVGSASAQTRLLRLADVLARARGQAPQVVSARLAVDEARGRLLGAVRRFDSNPEIDASLGSRRGAGARFTDFGFGIGQTLTSGARRSARIESAHAAIARSSAEVEETTREILRLAASAYFRGLHARERVRLLDAAQAIASTVLAVADRRYRAGDIAVLDVNLARASLARVRADRETAEAARTLALGDLKQVLGLDEDIGVQGALAQPQGAGLTELLQAAVERPDVRALEAAVREADADVRAAGTFARPEYGVGVRYSQEGADRVVLGSFTIGLPLVSKGQDLRAVAAARAARLRSELEATRARIRVEVGAAWDACARRIEAVRILESDAMPGLDENETLSTRSFDVGQLGLPDLLLIRREILDTRFQYLDALLEAALARTDLDATAGTLR